MTTDAHNKDWPHRNVLKMIRTHAGNLSAERAAARIGKSRSTWVAWESGRQIPEYESLKAIVEQFGIPPELIGYEPPKGWELVPAQWIRDEVTKLDRILDILERRSH